LRFRRNDAKVDLRMRLLGSDPASFGLKPSADLPRVWAALMEIGMPNGSASVVAVADGSASMYTGTGGGMIGAGEHESVRAPARAFLQTIEKLLDAIPVAEAAPTSRDGEYAFVALTFDGMRRAVDREAALSQGSHPLLAAFVAGHELVTAMRSLQTTLQGKTAGR